MKDAKFYPLLAISIVLLLASFIMLCIMGYNFYTNAQYQKGLTAVSLKKNDQQKKDTRDSLQKLYTKTIDEFQLGNQLDSTTLSKADSLQLNLGTKISDYIKLKNEIGGLLNNNSSIADLSLAKQKIEELQSRVEELRNRNLDVENENKRLSALLVQYINTSPKQIDNSTRIVTEKNNLDIPFIVTDLRLAANDENAAEVANAEQTEKFVGSFIVKNNTTLNNAELMVVVIQPDGRVLKNAWESGSFDTNEGKKIYSRKFQFDYNKGEAKKLNFSLLTDNGQKGNYTMLLYNKGKVIGRTVKTIS